MDITTSSSQYLLNRSEIIVERIITDSYEKAVSSLNRIDIYNLANRLMNENSIVF